MMEILRIKTDHSSNLQTSNEPNRFVDSELYKYQILLILDSFII